MSNAVAVRSFMDAGNLFLRVLYGKGEPSSGGSAKGGKMLEPFWVYGSSSSWWVYESPFPN